MFTLLLLISHQPCANRNMSWCVFILCKFNYTIGNVFLPVFVSRKVSLEFVAHLCQLHRTLLHVFSLLFSVLQSWLHLYFLILINLSP